MDMLDHFYSLTSIPVSHPQPYSILFRQQLSNSRIVLEEASFSNIERDVKGLSKVGDIKIVVNRVSRFVGEPPVNRGVAKKPHGKDVPSKSSHFKDLQICANVHEKVMKGEVKSHGIT
jgi:hypothetical protein